MAWPGAGAGIRADFSGLRAGAAGQAPCHFELAQGPPLLSSYRIRGNGPIAQPSHGRRQCHVARRQETRLLIPLPHQPVPFPARACLLPFPAWESQGPALPLCPRRAPSTSAAERGTEDPRLEPRLPFPPSPARAVGNRQRAVLLPGGQTRGPVLLCDRGAGVTKPQDGASWHRHAPGKAREQGSRAEAAAAAPLWHFQETWHGGGSSRRKSPGASY